MANFDEQFFETFGWWKELLDETAKSYGFNTYQELEAHLEEKRKMENATMKNQNYGNTKHSLTGSNLYTLATKKVDELSDPIRKEKTALPNDYINDILIDLYLFMKDKESK